MPGGGSIGYPIFRLDYSNDEDFELYKMYWDHFLKTEFYVPEVVDPDDITWFWVNDKTRLDGKGPLEVRRLFQELCVTAFPPGSKFLWLCLTVDREAIESMLRVYGPPAKQVLEALPLSLPSVRTKEISFLPYVAAVDTTWAEANGDEITNPIQDGSQVNDGKYRGQFKCALRSVFRLWQMEQVIQPEELYPKNGKIWGDTSVVFETPLID
ncbi:hypothetical protein BKA67DRAFT_661039 [Truncatella angustata]|uniref:Uncharacterized protein n=1 Tax=Truncatella angustata TaxID=152316 RepID=A0A9P8ZVU4_9PEZI|nr:uncharacterized protein BKA67DRAFT_661039 [Truncatella angustata]KAH6652291.1 hypothetical protein BKA67DRAFT_661039 [Truncatella angustata]